MTYRISGLAREPFSALFALDDAALAARNIVRTVADAKPGFPCRITLRDAEPGDTLLLLPYVHQPAESPYHASGPIFVGVDNGPPADCIDHLPEVMQTRPLSLRGYDGRGLMVEADLATGSEHTEATIARFFADARIAYIHAHFARRGCFAARVDRA